MRTAVILKFVFTVSKVNITKGARCLLSTWIIIESGTNSLFLRLPYIFRGVSSVKGVARLDCIADILTPYQMKGYKIGLSCVFCGTFSINKYVVKRGS